MGMAAADDQFHVLAVDDSLIDRKLIERLLKTSSFQVTTVDSGSKALEFLGWHEDEDEDEINLLSNETSVSPKNHDEVEVNLVITDYCMPGMTGYDLLKKLKESSILRDIPVVIMSSENVPSRITRCLEEGAEEFILKPVKLSDVNNRLRPHMVKTKFKKDIQIDEKKPEKVEKQENKEIIITATAEEEAADSDIIQSLQQETAETNNNNNNKKNDNDDNDDDDNDNKRKSMDEGISPDRTRPRYSDLTVMSS